MQPSVKQGTVTGGISSQQQHLATSANESSYVLSEDSSLSVCEWHDFRYHPYVSVMNMHISSLATHRTSCGIHYIESSYTQNF